MTSRPTATGPHHLEPAPSAAAPRLVPPPLRAGQLYPDPLPKSPVHVPFLCKAPVPGARYHGCPTTPGAGTPPVGPVLSSPCPPSLLSGVAPPPFPSRTGAAAGPAPPGARISGGAAAGPFSVWSCRESGAGGRRGGGGGGLGGGGEWFSPAPPRPGAPPVVFSCVFLCPFPRRAVGISRGTRSSPGAFRAP